MRLGQDPVVAACGAPYPYESLRAGLLVGALGLATYDLARRGWSKAWSTNSPANVSALVCFLGYMWLNRGRAQHTLACMTAVTKAMEV